MASGITLCYHFVDKYSHIIMTRRLTGGKFANGAVTGAFSRLFNDELHARRRAAQARLSLTGHSVGGIGPTHTAIQYVDENGNKWVSP